jgi:ABC-2 type transport system ATP-binding protein
VIEFDRVSKKYPSANAVRDFSLSVQDGEFFGLLGPNGAGKTTLVRMASSLTPITSGSISINGVKVDRNDTKAKSMIGVVPQYTNLESELTAFDNLEYHGLLYGIPKPKRRQKIEELLEFTQLSERSRDKAKSFSGGMQRKLMIAKTLMHEPAIMLLDEPTVGLDALARRKIWDLLKSMNEGGLTILLTTHYLEEAESLCARVGMIDEGRLIALGSPKDIVESLGPYVLEHFEDSKTAVDFFTDRKSALDASFGLLGEFKVREANLEDAFISLTNKRLVEKDAV